jgi:hypothetical protein
MPLTEEQRREILASVGAWPPPPPKPKPEPVVKLVANRELSVEAQRERTARELQALGRAERQAVGLVRGSALYYQVQEQALAEAKYWATHSGGSVEHRYDPIRRFEREGDK